MTTKKCCMTESKQRRQNESAREREREEERQRARNGDKTKERERRGGRKGNEEAEENYFLLFWMKTE
jgi:hypothetical protein